MAAHFNTPRLGHVILQTETQEKGFKFDNHNIGTYTTTARVGTGCCSAIDEEVLDGGFDYGGITALSGDLLREDGRGTLIVLHTLANHLLQNPLSEGVVIDTIGEFDAFLFDALLRARLQDDSVPPGELESKINGVLDRVNVMRAFDFLGVVEALDELGTKLRSESPKESERILNAQPSKTEIEDSQDEDEDEDEEIVENEVLVPSEDALDFGESHETMAKNKHSIFQDERKGIGMVIIDNIAHVVSPMMKGSPVQAHGLLMPFLRSLRHLTSDYDICTILLSSIVFPQKNAGHHAQNPVDRVDEHTQSTPGRQSTMSSEDLDDARVSIFASTPGKPALGRSFAHCVDTHLFLSKVPKSIRDAEIFYAGRQNTRVELADVLEVIADRNAQREGRWAAFVVEELKILNAF